MAKTLGRLKRRSEFLAVARRGRRWAMPGVVLQVASGPGDNKNTAPIRVGFTASKKVGNAVQRNRVKRRLRALAAEVLATSGRDGHDYVLIGRQGTLTRPYVALANDLQMALSRVHQRKKGSR